MIPNIGILRAKALFSAGFDSIDKIIEASEEELANVPGIGQRTAKSIKKSISFVGLEKLKSMEYDEDLVEEEFECPVCGTILSAYEGDCYECGSKLKQVSEEAGDLERAISVYNRKLKMKPEDADIWYARAYALAEIQRYEEAISSFDKVLQLDPFFEGVWHAKANVYANAGQHEKAAECFRKAMMMSLEAADESERGLDLGILSLDERDTTDLDNVLSEIDGLIDEEGGAVDAQDTPTIKDMEPQKPLKEEPMQIEATGDLASDAFLPEFDEPMEGPTAPGELSETSSLAQQRAVKSKKPGTAKVDDEINLSKLMKNKRRKSKTITRLDKERDEQAPPLPKREKPRAAPPREKVPEKKQFGLGAIKTKSSKDLYLSKGPKQKPNPMDMMLENKLLLAVIAIAIGAALVFLAFYSGTDDPDGGSSISIDGRFNEWDNIDAVLDDEGDMDIPSLDIIRASISSSSSSIYFYIGTASNIFPPGETQSVFYLFIDADEVSDTGFLFGNMGADYHLQVTGMNQQVTGVKLLQYQDASSNEWSEVASGNGEIAGTQLEGSVHLTSSMKGDISDGFQAQFASKSWDQGSTVDFTSLVDDEHDYLWIQLSDTAPRIAPVNEYVDIATIGFTSNTVVQMDSISFELQGNYSSSNINSASITTGGASYTGSLSNGALTFDLNGLEVTDGSEMTMSMDLSGSGHFIALELVDVGSVVPWTCSKSMTPSFYIGDIKGGYVVDGGIGEWNLDQATKDTDTGKKPDSINITYSNYYTSDSTIYIMSQVKKDIFSGIEVPYINLGTTINVPLIDTYQVSISLNGSGNLQITLDGRLGHIIGEESEGLAAEKLQKVNYAWNDDNLEICIEFDDSVDMQDDLILLRIDTSNWLSDDRMIFS